MLEESDGQLHAAIYARVSTEDQGKGYSIETQIAGCHQYARQHGMVVWESHVFVDRGISGATLDRPGLDALRTLVRSRAIQALIVYDVDRLSRNLGHQCLLVEEQQQAGVAFHVARAPIEQSDEGRLLLHMQGAFAEYERSKTRERSLRGKAAMIARGIPSSHVAPYGYRWTRVPHASTLEIDEAEAAVVRQIFRWCLEGRTIRSIAMQLTQERVPTRRKDFKLGTKRTPPWHWNKPTVCRMLRYEGYVGRIYAGKEKRINGKCVKQPRERWIELSIPAIVDQATFDAVGERLTENQRKASRNRKHVYLLSSLTLRCGLCGGGMSGCTKINRRKDRPSWTSTYYICNTHVSRTDRSHCRVYVPGRIIEPVIWAGIERVLTDPKTILEAITLAQQGGMEQRLEAQRRLDSLDRAIAQKDAEDGRLIEAYQGGAMTVEELKHHRERVATDKHDLIEQRWKAQEALSQLGAVPPEPYELEAYVSVARRTLQTGSLSEKRAVIERLGVSFVVDAWATGDHPGEGAECDPGGLVCLAGNGCRASRSSRKPP